MTTKEMKAILHKKLKAENCYFTLSDISIKKTGEKEYTIIIKDYNPYSFKMEFYMDNLNTFVVETNVYYKEKYVEIIAFEESYKTFDFTTSLIELGYYIGTRF